MPAGTPGLGYRSRAAFRLVGNSSGSYLSAVGTPTPHTLGDFDLLPFLKEQIQATIESQLNDVLDGGAGYSDMNQIARNASGALELQGHYIGLDQIFAAALGWEGLRLTTGTKESPDFAGSLSCNGSLTTNATTNELIDTGANFPATLVGKYVRITDQNDTYAAFPWQVRRIATRVSSTSLTVTPNWNGTPEANTGYEIGNIFQHVYECSKSMHSEAHADIYNDQYVPYDYINRFGVVGIDKGVSVWEWQGAMVNKLKVKLDSSGLQITAELFVFWRDLRTTSRNSSASGWNYSPVSVIFNRINFADTSFMLKAHENADPDSGDAVGITSLEFELDNKLDGGLHTTSSGLYIAEPMRTGKRTVTGSFTVPRYVADTYLNNFTAGDLLMAELACTGPNVISGGSNALDYVKLRFLFRSMKIKVADVPVSDAGAIGQKYDFQALQPPSQSGDDWPAPSTGADNSELMIITRNEYPFNPYMGQHYEYDAAA